MCTAVAATTVPLQTSHSQRMEREIKAAFYEQTGSADCSVYGSGARQFSLSFFPMISRNILVRFFMVYVVVFIE